MERRFEFDGAEVRALVEEAKAADEHLMTEAQRVLASGSLDADADGPATGAEPALWVMSGGDGVYLRSNASERPDERVAYARGDGAAEKTAAEPICEVLDASTLEPVQPGDTLVVTLSERKVRLSLIRDGA